jgi:hypothetical protein
MNPLQNLSSRRKLTGLIRKGVGMSECTWQMPAQDSGIATDVLGAEILGWVQRSMGEMRRPYGVNQVVLALACRDADGQVQCTNASGVQRPETFYGEEGRARVLAFLADVESVAPQQRTEIVGALLSLGDLAYALQARKAA